MIVYIFRNLSTEIREALTGRALGLKRLSRCATSYITFHQIVGPGLELGTPGHCSLAFPVVGQVGLWFDVMCGNSRRLNQQQFGLKRSEDEGIG